MAYFHTTVLDEQIKALPTVDTASGSVATFDTDKAENLINLEVAITATGGGGTPVSPIAINGFSACNLSVNGTTETIPFGQTVYGGRLNVGSGVLTVTHAIYRAVDNNNITLYGSSTNNNVFRIVTGLYATLIGQLCNIATYNANAYQANDDRVNTFQMSDTGNVYIQLSKTVANTLNDFKTYILNNDIDIYYELATPTTIQLDSKQIQTIANSVNNIYADTGDIIDLKFVLSVGKAIS